MSDLRIYEPPRLEPLPFLAFDKHQTRSILSAPSFEEDYDVADLLAEYGSPLYIVSERRLRGNLQRFREAFATPRLDTRVAYSVKTNYLPAICAVLREEGAWAEVVSGMEYSLARALAVPPGEIIFNGPHKTREELERAIAEGAIVNIDNFDELEAVQRIAGNLGRVARIGLRISFRSALSAWTKFGFNDDNGDSQRALERVAELECLDLVLLHNHCGTFVLTPSLYGEAVDRLIDCAERARALDLSPTMIDVGGGFPSENVLKPAFDFAGGSNRSGDFLAPFAEAVCTRLEKAAHLFGGRPALVLEPGRAVVDSSAQLACTVVAKKTMSEDDAIIVDAGVNLLPTVCYYDHGIDTPPRTETPGHNGFKHVDVYGPLCMQADKLRDGASLPALEVGDPLVVSNVGAYCHTMSTQFIQPRPATVLLGPDGPELIRRREDWRDIFALDRLPSRLRPDDCSL